MRTIAYLKRGIARGHVNNSIITILDNAKTIILVFMIAVEHGKGVNDGVINQLCVDVCD